MRKFAIVLILILGSLGCEPAKTEPDATGTWISDSQPPVKLTVKEDRTYKVELNPDVVEGTWLYRNGHLSLMPDKVNGMTQDEALLKSTREIQEMGKASFDTEKSMQVWDLELSADGKTLTPAPGIKPGSAALSFTFKRT